MICWCKDNWAPGIDVAVDDSRDFHKFFNLNGKITILCANGDYLQSLQLQYIVFTDSVPVFLDEFSYCPLAATYFCQYFWKPSATQSSNHLELLQQSWSDSPSAGPFSTGRGKNCTVGDSAYVLGAGAPIVPCLVSCCCGTSSNWCSRALSARKVQSLVTCISGYQVKCQQLFIPLLLHQCALSTKLLMYNALTVEKAGIIIFPCK